MKLVEALQVDVQTVAFLPEVRTCMTGDYCLVVQLDATARLRRLRAAQKKTDNDGYGEVP